MTPGPAGRAGSAPRLPTGDPRRFLIPSEYLPAGFAARADHPPDPPVEPRPAATVALLRDGRGGPEALLLRRHGKSGFAAGAWVFPGGSVDAADRDPGLHCLLPGLESGAWAERLGVGDPAEAAGYLAAALRETLEETGVVLGEGPGSRRAAAGWRLEELREGLLAHRLTLGEVVERGVRFSGDGLVYLAHWITPEPELRRYDTRFFLAPVPAALEVRPHQLELVDFRWVTPVEAVTLYRRGDLHMLPPTVHTLERLLNFRSVAEAADALRDAPVPTILPVMRPSDQGVIIEVLEKP
ncbi:MAG: NUDIX hydrolase [Longimicrobiaceae bacterium]